MRYYIGWIKESQGDGEGRRFRPEPFFTCLVYLCILFFSSHLQFLFFISSLNTLQNFTNKKSSFFFYIVSGESRIFGNWYTCQVHRHSLPPTAKAMNLVAIPFDHLHSGLS